VRGRKTKETMFNAQTPLISPRGWKICKRGFSFDGRSVVFSPIARCSVNETKESRE